MGSPAADAGRWRSDTDVWLDHVTLTDADLGWLGAATSVTAWAVRTPVDFWARLPLLERLDVRGGTASTVDFVRNCMTLRWLQINQVRGVEDLDALVTLDCLEFLSLYGLPRVAEIPSLSRLARLRFAQVGSMKGLLGVGGLLDAPHLEQLTLIRAVGLDPGDGERIAAHPSIGAFDWFSEDVPLKTWVPVVERVAKPKPTVNVQTWPLPAAQNGER